MKNLTDILPIEKNAKTKHFDKGEILQKEGDKSSLSYYVERGLLRSYTIDDKGKEHVFMFASEGWIITDIESQEFNHPAKLFIDCVEESEIIVFDREYFKVTHLTESQLRENIYLMAMRIAVLQRRVIMLMSASARMRYELFLETYPKLLNRVPQWMIASYLGVTPQALSTIRGKISRKK